MSQWFATFGESVSLVALIALLLFGLAAVVSAIALIAIGATRKNRPACLVGAIQLLLIPAMPLLTLQLAQLELLQFGAAAMAPRVLASSVLLFAVLDAASAITSLAVWFALLKQRG